MALVANTGGCFTSLPAHLKPSPTQNKQRQPKPPSTSPRASSFSLPSTAASRQAPTPHSPLSKQIHNLCSEGSLHDALLLLTQNSPENFDLAPHAEAIGTLLQACSSNRELDVGRRVHELISSSKELMSNAVLTTRLLTMYSMCGSPSDSRHVFEGLERRNLFQWNAMISGYARNELWDAAIDLFYRLMSTTDLKPDNFTLPCVLKSCGGLLDVEMGRTVHGIALKLGLGSDTFISNSLISVYGKCGFIDDAAQVFETMSARNLVSWNTMICGLSENGSLQEGFDFFRKMISVGEGSMRPDEATVVTVLPMCAGEGWLEMGRAVHGLSAKLGLVHELRVSNALIDMYAKCCCLFEARRLFGRTLGRNVVSWNAMIGGCARNGDADGTFHLLREMSVEDGVMANEVTVLNALPACLGPSELPNVKELHGYAIRNELQTDDLVSNALIAAYAKCGSLESAGHVFNGMEMKTVGSWNALIGGYAQNGDPRKAIDLFLQMASLGEEPDWFSIGSLLLACARSKDLLNGKSIHGFVLRNGLERDSFIKISLLSLYIQCGETSASRVLFDAVEEKDPVSWNAMIAGYSQNGLPEDSLKLFRRLLRDGYEPSMIAMTGAFMACAELSALRLGREAHGFALKANVSEDAFVGCSIIDMYAKCGSIEQACSFFSNLKNRDAVSWTVTITGYGINGFGAEAINLFDEMRREGLKPDAFTYVGILLACSHAGMVEEGLRYFEEMKNKDGVEPKLEHYACVADMLGRAGRLAEAARLVEEMPVEPDCRIWGALLGACRIHGDVSLGGKVAEKLLELEPDRAEHHVLASNLYASAGRWDDARRVRKRMKEIGLRKDPGCSWIDVGGRVYNFVAGDNRLPESEEIRMMWRSLEEKIRGIGYVPDTASVLHELEEEEKLEILRGHSEKQAMAFGLLKTSGGTKVRVCKNIRMCRDCHEAAKLVARVAGREIVVRDNKRFHHFRDGFCSCGDFW
ncbi:pentatricopeptide repeat-containing protein At1g18485 [Phoenix dactylifera]|uniref:Pentatricopeptide repeat-containing protein At1g18485 n=1 Tax=Phoenix dactylifera TaxID=42345 RepID=A0A8B7BSN4_PHODC|nr:pentatricopeptide repeat-containing protein At1g18485 [Phoenix dactylifera]